MDYRYRLNTERFIMPITVCGGSWKLLQISFTWLFFCAGTSRNNASAVYVVYCRIYVTI